MKPNRPEEKLIEKDGRKYREVVKKSALPIWAAAAVWVIAALLFPMYKIGHIALIALVSVGVGLAVSKILPKETVLEEVPFYTGNTDLDAMVKEIAKAQDEIRAARDKVAASRPAAAAQMDSILTTVGKIRDALAAEPRDLPVVRRFMNYYLPTTQKLATKYAFAVSQGADSANITETASAIENALSQIDVSFKHQLDALFADDALDITTDITVLESLLTRDNLK